MLYPSVLLSKARAPCVLFVSSTVRPALENRKSKHLEFCILPFHFHTCGDETGTTAAGLCVLHEVFHGTVRTGSAPNVDSQPKLNFPSPLQSDV